MNSLAVAAFLGFGAVLVLFGANASEIIRELSLDYADFGFVASLLSMGIGSGILCAGSVVDRWPRRPLFLASVGSVTLATLPLDAQTSYSMLLASSLVIGFGAGFYETLLNTVIVENAGAGAPRRLLFIHSAATFGATLTPFAIGFFRESAALAWHDSFFAAGLFHAALLLGVPLLPRRAPEGKRVSGDSKPRVGVLPERKPNRALLVAICFVTFVYVGFESTMTFFVADYAETVLALESGRASGVVGFFWLGLLTGRIVVGLSPRTPGAGSTAALAAVAATIVGFFFLGFLDAIVPIEWAIGLSGFFLGGVFPIMIGLAGMTLPNRTGMAVGLAAGLGSLGGFAIPWLTGVVASLTSLTIGLSTLAIWLVLLVVGSIAVHRQHAI